MVVDLESARSLYRRFLFYDVSVALLLRAHLIAMPNGRPWSMQEQQLSEIIQKGIEQAIETSLKQGME